MAEAEKEAIREKLQQATDAAAAFGKTGTAAAMEAFGRPDGAPPSRLQPIPDLVAQRGGVGGSTCAKCGAELLRASQARICFACGAPQQSEQMPLQPPFNFETSVACRLFLQSFNAESSVCPGFDPPETSPVLKDQEAQGRETFHSDNRLNQGSLPDPHDVTSLPVFNSGTSSDPEASDLVQILSTLDNLNSNGMQVPGQGARDSPKDLRASSDKLSSSSMGENKLLEAVPDIVARVEEDPFASMPWVNGGSLLKPEVEKNNLQDLERDGDQRGGAVNGSLLSRMSDLSFMLADHLVLPARQ